MLRAKQQQEDTWITSPSDKMHVLFAEWVAWSNLKSSWVRGKCLFNSIKGQFIMCILPGKHNVSAGPLHLHYFQTTAEQKGTLIYFWASTGEFNVCWDWAREGLTHSEALWSCRGSYEFLECSYPCLRWNSVLLSQYMHIYYLWMLFQYTEGRTRSAFEMENMVYALSQVISFKTHLSLWQNGPNITSP